MYEHKVVKYMHTASRKNVHSHISSCGQATQIARLTKTAAELRCHSLEAKMAGEVRGRHAAAGKLIARVQVYV